MQMKSGIELMRLIAVILITFTHTRNDLSEGYLYFLVETLPTYGTAILSIISGYLYYTVSRKKDNLLNRKIISLAIPYLIANLSVLLLVLAGYYLFDYQALNRLSYDYTLITEGVLSLNSPPINPPTFFIRDVFMIFALIALVTQKDFRTLLIIIPFLVFGLLFLRLDIVVLFVIGIVYAKYEHFCAKQALIIIALIISIAVGVWFTEYLKFSVSFLFFVSIVDLQIKFWKTGRYTYLLHLYHSPIIVLTYPFVNSYVESVALSIFTQILIAIVAVYLLYLITKKFKFLEILSGGR
jgi:hypothetical protein